MSRGTLIVTGAILMVISSILFITDFLSLHSYLLYGLAALAFFGSIMTGKKLAAYIHDLNLTRNRGYSPGPAMFIYLWMFMFVLFLLIYTISKLALGYFIKILFLPLGGTYISLIYNIIMLCASYLLFRGLHLNKNRFLTVWGKSAENMHKITKSAPKTIASAASKGTEIGTSVMNTGMDTMKKIKKNL